MFSLLGYFVNILRCLQRREGKIDHSSMTVNTLACPVQPGYQGGQPSKLRSSLLCHNVYTVCCLDGDLLSRDIFRYFQIFLDWEDLLILVDCVMLGCEVWNEVD